MTTAELKLAAFAIGFTLLVFGAFAWTVRDWIQVREKRKYRLKYYDWLERKSIQMRKEALERCWASYDRVQDRLAEIQSDEGWEEMFNEKLQDRLDALRENGPREQVNLDYYHFWRE